jgi:hypothetical protein
MPGTTPRGYPYPLYTEANNFPTQDQNLANAIDSDVQTNLVTAVNSALNQPACRAADSGGTQTLTTGVVATVTFPFEVFDNANIFNPGVSTTNFTIPTTGFWMVMAYVTFNNNSNGGGRHVDMRVGGAIFCSKTLAGVSGDFTQVSFTHLKEFTAGNVVTFTALQNSGANDDISSRAVSLVRVSG